MFDAPGRVRWEDAADPVIADPAAAIVRPIAVATCDIDVGALRGIYPMAGPYPLGHEGVAEVVDIGDAVVDVRVGDRVVVPFQISCGSCGACRRGRTGNCEAHPRLSTFGLGATGRPGVGRVARGPRARAACRRDAGRGAGPHRRHDDRQCQRQHPRRVALRRTATRGRARRGGARRRRRQRAELDRPVRRRPRGRGRRRSRVVYLDRDATRLDIAGSLGAEAIEAANFHAKPAPSRSPWTPAAPSRACVVRWRAPPSTVGARVRRSTSRTRASRCSRCTRGAARCTPAACTCARDSGSPRRGGRRLRSAQGDFHRRRLGRRRVRARRASDEARDRPFQQRIDVTVTSNNLDLR